jgi:hypothetical protein
MQQYVCTVQHAHNYFCTHEAYIHTLYGNNAPIMVYTLLMLIFQHPITSVHINHMTIFLHACTSLYAHHLHTHIHIQAAIWTHTVYTDISAFKGQHSYTPRVSIFVQSSDSMHIHNTSKLSTFRLYSNNQHNSIKCSRADNQVKVWKSCSVPETDQSPSLQGANDGSVNLILVTRCYNMQYVSPLGQSAGWNGSPLG